jgi:hypothetical protein
MVRTYLHLHEISTCALVGLASKNYVATFHDHHVYSSFLQSNCYVCQLIVDDILDCGLSAWIAVSPNAYFVGYLMTLESIDDGYC